MLETKRRVIGQMIVCQGCCCGATHSGSTRFGALSLDLTGKHAMQGPGRP